MRSSHVPLQTVPMRRAIYSQLSFAPWSIAVPSLLVMYGCMNCVFMVFEARLQGKGLLAAIHNTFEWTGVLTEMSTIPGISTSQCNAGLTPT